MYTGRVGVLGEVVRKLKRNLSYKFYDFYVNLRYINILEFQPFFDFPATRVTG